MTAQEATEKARVIDTRAEVLLQEVAARSKLAEIKASKSAADLAAEKLPVWCVLAVIVCVVLFVISCMYLPSENVSVICGLITLVVTSFTGILKSITDGTNGAAANSNGHDKPKAE